MKLVNYVIKEDELNVQSTNVAGARLGWLIDEWIVDIVFAQQWLVMNQSSYATPQLPIQMESLLQLGDEAFSLLYELYERIYQEAHAQLIVQGEPVALSVHDVQLLSAFLQPQLVFFASSQQKEESLWVQPWIDQSKPIPQPHHCYPGVACLLKKKGSATTKDQALEQIAGFCLINFWQMHGVWYAATSSSVVTIEEVTKLPNGLFELRHHEKVLIQQSFSLVDQFCDQIVKQSQQNPLYPGDILSMGCRSIDGSLWVEDQVELRMEHLGRLENRVDNR